MTQRLLFCGLTCSLIAMASWVIASEHRETPTVKAVKRARPAVVNIHTQKPAEEGKTVFSSGKGHRMNGMGTGIVVDERGYIVTNYHVVHGVDLIRTTFDDGSDYEAHVIKFDREHDLALIKVDAGKALAVAPLGTSSDLMLAESVIAIGNAFGYNGSVTLGIISALGRDVKVDDEQSYKNLIQTDASINPGNSGGPLLNMDGDVIGVNVAIRAGAQRIGFAIPIDDARKVIADLMSIESIDQNTHGIISKDIKTATQRHLIVMGAAPDSPAANAGLRAGDIVMKVGEMPVVDGVDLERGLLGKKTGESVDILVKRGDKTEKLPLSLMAQKIGKSSLNAQVVSRAQSEPRAKKEEPRLVKDDPETDKIWTILGVRLSVLPNHQLPLVQPRYKGGVKVVDVRANSPAARNGIRKGDILVGLRNYETLSTDNISWILGQPGNDGENDMLFYIVRGSETLFGHLQVALK